MTRKDQSMIVKFLAPAVVTGLLLSATMSLPQAAAQQAGLDADSSFMQMAGSLGLLQAKLGKLAEEKGSSAGVKDFGKRMVADYAKANEELASGAKQAAFPQPVMLRQHQQVAERFSRVGRSSFDKKYMAEIVNYSREALDLFQRESKGGRVESLKQLASRMLPTLQEHLELATQTAGSVGADVTASTTSPARQGP
jgi:putative membrane protein